MLASSQAAEAFVYIVMRHHADSQSACDRGLRKIVGCMACRVLFLRVHGMHHICVSIDMHLYTRYIYMTYKLVKLRFCFNLYYGTCNRIDLSRTF